MLGNFLGLGVLLLVVLMAGLVLAGLVMFPILLGRRARQFGYPSMRAYLRAAPRSDWEKRDAVDLTFKGVALCVLGLLFPPFVLIGLVPLFYGGRKLMFASMGLGLVDDADHSEV